jgi:beta-carotene 3-hydroxylase
MNLHDHHVPNRDTFLKKRYVFLIYAVPSWLCIMLGSMYAVWPVMYIGFGILA